MLPHGYDGRVSPALIICYVLTAFCYSWWFCCLTSISMARHALYPSMVMHPGNHTNISLHIDCYAVAASKPARRSFAKPLCLQSLLDVYNRVCMHVMVDRYHLKACLLDDQGGLLHTLCLEPPEATESRCMDDSHRWLQQIPTSPCPPKSMGLVKIPNCMTCSRRVQSTAAVG